jgi:ribosomal protein L35
MKTNKSWSKRLKVTKSGKTLARRPGQNHFNAKAARGKQLNAKRSTELTFKNKDLGRYLPH